MYLRGATPALVAREPELAALEQAVARAAAGDAATVIVAGDAGVGKTRLVEELMRTVRSSSLVLLGRCVDVGGLAYAPVAGALRALAVELSAGELDDALGPGRAELARLVPELAADLDVLPGGKGQLFGALLAALGRLGQRRPVVLVLEDLHWADESTLELLRFLVRSAAAERLALIATYRSDGSLRPYFAELRRDPRVQWIDLRPFSREQLAEHVAALRGTPASPAALDALYARSEGNPFFTEELLAAPSAALPESLRDSLALGLERLPPSARGVVRVLAAAGRRVGHALLERACAASPDELAAALRPALDARVIVAAGGAYEFRHALIREAAYAELLPGERVQVHAVLARELDGPAGELAHHLFEAGEYPGALAASIRAADEADRAYAHPEALRHLQRALELRDDAGVAERAADTASAAGEASLAIALARRAVELDPRAGRHHARLARLLWDAGRGPEALPASERAVALTPSEPTAERARTLESHARLLLLTGRAEQAGAPLEEALVLARDLGERELEAAVLATRVIALAGRTDALLPAAREALAFAQRHGDPDTLLRAYINAAEALDHGGRVEEAVLLAREAVEHAGRLGLERVMGVHLQGEIASRLIKLGRYDEAADTIALGRRSVPEGAAAVALHDAAATLAVRRGEAPAGRAEGAVEAGSGQLTARAAAALAERALWAGEPERAWEIVEAALALASEDVWYSAPLYALGTWACADRALRASAEGAAGRATPPPPGAAAAPTAATPPPPGADAAPTAATPPGAAATALLARLDERLTTCDSPEPAAYRAQAAAELTRLEDASDPAAWRDARRRWERLGFPVHAALCGWREAEALLLAGADRAPAADTLQEAARRSEVLGARPLTAAVQALGRRARIAVGAQPEAPPAGLSPRELEVLALLADGRTNREIGATLFISAKTASAHVSRILAKLGAANRAEAATIAHRLGIE